MKQRHIRLDEVLAQLLLFTCSRRLKQEADGQSHQLLRLAERAKLLQASSSSLPFLLPQRPVCLRFRSGRVRMRGKFGVLVQSWLDAVRHMRQVSQPPRCLQCTHRSLACCLPTAQALQPAGRSGVEPREPGEVSWLSQAFAIYRDFVSGNRKPSLAVLNLVSRGHFSHRA